ncbi:MAG: D-2-hydroxyacid dehydrogenase, partial [Novosphingobium sp.]|nr:D-2-hydroxyacid dehydrogenase [Novosphingobium sp.]
GVMELAGSKALVLGAGAIGQGVARMLAGFDVEVVTVRRSPAQSDLGPDQWRARLDEFDWVILAVPSTPDTAAMIGGAELAAMKSTAHIVNIARGEVIDQPALVAALQAKAIGGAFLDVTTPEPLPSDHVLWTLPNAHVTMHLSGQAQNKMFQRGVARFIANIPRFHAGEKLEAQVDLALGY